MVPKIKHFIPLAIVITAFCGLTYVAVHQDYRQTANDPQIQLSEDSASVLENGVKPQDLLAKIEVDLNKSLSPFLIVYNEAQEPVASQAVLDGRIPKPPVGVFDYVKSHKQERFTWEPKPGVRIAAVVTKYEGSSPGYVLAGRSIREVEKREDMLTKETGAVLITTLLITFFATLVFRR